MQPATQPRLLHVVDDAMQVQSADRIRPLPAAAATLADASSTSAAAVYSCSAC
jgi:hypothetical protein